VLDIYHKVTKLRDIKQRVKKQKEVIKQKLTGSCSLIYESPLDNQVHLDPTGSKLICVN